MKQLLFCIAIIWTLGPQVQPSEGQDSPPTQSERPQRQDRMNRGMRPGQGGGRGGRDPQQMIERLFKNDKNGDGKLTRDEVGQGMARFLDRLDTNRDGILTKEEAQAKMAAGRGGREGESRGNQGQRRNGSAGLQVGEAAPNFKLKSLDGKSETELTTIRKQKPVILFFGSYT